MTYTSKFDRAYQTAVLAGLKDIETTADVSEGGLVVTTDENNRRAAALKKMLATAPKAGTNTVIITHRPNILDALGKDWFDVKEGEASIFHVENGGYRLVARACRWTSGRAWSLPNNAQQERRGVLSPGAQAALPGHG